ncbi:GNAT family N-acetyltransferase [Pseudomonas sp. NW5]|uniref:GNAT family N-acetyltransferase n=1 Tax=Pseudomonas sp. NW5 TaxID=2934934 RepID=UPI002020046A|nr:GNAT family N-acetyltransferase [Pseudomonas sp. NW5]MCL7462073.1 GNAT family N-acetyltransferase [Pseudomonas sp. NW5]
MHCKALPALQYPLLQRFYRTQRSAMRIPAGAQPWVLHEGEIVAALCLTPQAEGYWLTGLLVDHAQRGRGLATQLLSEVRRRHAGPIWLFCHPDLQPFYQRRGLSESQQLPAALAERLARYQRSKALLAMQF